jgi:hypothetical protein
MLPSWPLLLMPRREMLLARLAAPPLAAAVARVLDHRCAARINNRLQRNIIHAATRHEPQGSLRSSQWSIAAVAMLGASCSVGHHIPRATAHVARKAWRSLHKNVRWLSFSAPREHAAAAHQWSDSEVRQHSRHIEIRTSESKDH